jgi:AcrR family transcriptional regulator
LFSENKRIVRDARAARLILYTAVRVAPCSGVTNLSIKTVRGSNRKRPYKMRQRAADQERTRQRIVEATVELHGTVGPKNSSISAIARRAGVQRLTVYRHFPDETELFIACSSLWLSRHPPPDPAAWASAADPASRTRAALTAVYAYFRCNAAMLQNVYRDAAEVPALQGPLQAFQGYLDAVRNGLLATRSGGQRKLRRLSATLAHVLAFSTWQSLSRLELSDTETVRLVLTWIEASVD